MSKSYAFAIGDRVTFARGFLQSTFQYTGPEAPTHRGPFARGVVTGTQELSGQGGHLVRVLWADGHECSALAYNLVAVKRLHLEAA